MPRMFTSTGIPPTFDGGAQPLMAEANETAEARLETCENICTNHQFSASMCFLGKQCLLWIDDVKPQHAIAIHDNWHHASCLDGSAGWLAGLFACRLG